MKRNQLVAKTWIYFTFNYGDPKEVIDYICKKTNKEWLKAHLEGKFNHIYDTFGSSAVMNRFYTELDKNLREALVDYALMVYAPIGMRLTEEEIAMLAE